MEACRNCLPQPILLVASSTLREASCAVVASDGSHRSEARYDMAKRQERVGWVTRRGEASAVVVVGAAAQALVACRFELDPRVKGGYE